MKILSENTFASLKEGRDAKEDFNYWKFQYGYGNTNRKYASCRRNNPR